jgi:hypothetical protein
MNYAIAFLAIWFLVVLPAGIALWHAAKTNNPEDQ